MHTVSLQLDTESSENELGSAGYRKAQAIAQRLTSREERFAVWRAESEDELKEMEILRHSLLENLEKVTLG